MSRPGVMSPAEQARFDRDLHRRLADIARVADRELRACDDLHDCDFGDMSFILLELIDYHETAGWHAQQRLGRAEARCCPVCATELAPAALGRPIQYCSSACRQQAYRDRSS